MAKELDDDNLPDDQVQDEHGQPDEAAEQDLATELPEDPEALKAFAAEQQQKAIEAQREARRHREEAERQKENAREQKTKADWLSRQNLRLEGMVDSKQPAPAKAAKPSPSEDIENALAGVEDLAGMVADDKGTVRLAKILTEKVFEPLINRRLEERVTQERQMTAQERAGYNRVISQYRDLEDPNSELAQEAAEIFEQIIEESPALNNATGFELAASRAAVKIGYTPSKSKPNPNPQPRNGNERIRRAQGNPVPPGGGGGKQPVVVDSKLRQMATKTFGSQVDDKVLQRVAQRVSAQNRNRQ